MAEVLHPVADDDGGLGALLGLLDGAADSFRTVQVTYRTWRHEQRLREAFHADIEEQKRRGAAISIASAVRAGDPGPAETTETIRIWREGQRVREERHGGRRDGYYGVADGPLWWFWSEQVGAMSNQNDPSITSGIGQEFQVMLDPTPLLSALRFRVAGNSQIAGRETVTAHATPRPADVRHGIPLRKLHALGTGADHYQLEVDQQRGVLLASTAIRDDQPFYKITALAISFDELIPAETFQFRPPKGEQIHSPRPVHNLLQHVTPTQAQQRAPFTVVTPDQVPTGWRVRCIFIDPSQRPSFPEFPAFAASPPLVMLHYRSDDGRQSVSISQMAATDAAGRYGTMLNDQGWHEVLRDGTPIKIRDGTPIKIPPGDEWLPAQAHLTRYGTFAHLSSQGLTADELTTIAANLKPVPETGDV
jgi:hypothetical protein